MGPLGGCPRFKDSLGLLGNGLLRSTASWGTMLGGSSRLGFSANKYIKHTSSKPMPRKIKHLFTSNFRGLLLCTGSPVLGAPHTEKLFILQTFIGFCVRGRLCT